MSAVLQIQEETAAPAAPPRPNVDRQAANANKKKRREEEAKWRPDHSTPYWIHQLALKTDKASYVYHMALVRAQQSLYFFYHTLPDDVDAVSAAEAEINKRFEAIEKQLGDEIARCKAIIDGIGADLPTGYSGDPEIHEVAMYTPEAKRFATLVENYDQLNQQMDVLWYAGHVNRKVRAQKMQEYRNLLVSFSRWIYVESRRAKNAVREHRMMRDASRIAREKAKVTGQRQADGDVVTAAPKEAAAGVASAKATKRGQAASAEA
ncbi:hypothetical protein RKE25_22600 (plasmid) [Dyella sp. BiH032]|uniref:hypothetical protein n=1 Tax=Dyella sp. BiH032 TaxID=3075430 RepID=UPI0028933459|nr:hypothetical protein [Dyella sp. BiH032]WNL48325.1 hypothetical protein RKE25_22600 [Dyella sp. BiH032]